MKLRNTLVKDWPVLLILLLPFALLAWFWGQIPDSVPTHWGMSGEPDAWSDKGASLFLLPILSIGVYLLMVAVPYIDPKRKADNQQKALRGFRWMLAILMSGIFVMMLLQWLGMNVDIGKIVFLFMGVMFVVLGNYMQSLKPNYFIGLRTPWTLENSEIWRKTHRLGGRVWVAGGLLLLVLWFFFEAKIYFVIFITTVIVLALVPTVYSFVLYLQGRKQAGDTTE